jgi:hypothetical protein
MSVWHLLTSCNLGQHQRMVLSQDSRSSCEGSRASARRAGIQVAIKPRSVIVSITPPKTRGSPGVANETMCARMRPVSSPPAMPSGRPEQRDHSGPSQCGAHHMRSLRTECHADGLFPHSFRNRIRGHAEDTRNGQHCSEKSQDAERNSGGTGGNQRTIDGAGPRPHGERNTRFYPGKRPLQSTGNLIWRHLRSDRHDRILRYHFATDSLRERQEDDRLRFLVEPAILAVIHHADNLTFRGCPHREALADC